MALKSLTLAVLLALAAPCSGVLVLRNATAVAVAVRANATAAASMDLQAKQFMEVNLGPFPSAADACDYCFGSFTKTGDKPAGPVAPFCICMAYPDEGGHNMFCATPPSAAKYVADKNGCRCKARDMESMGSTTCEAIR
mmetsp:Transcript_20921/g.55407  ORF Transcript_20921/g.55407 Transcript_20921/m.55407 type:complete len:139 (-) Transcript_20921:92-508(-)